METKRDDKNKLYLKFEKLLLNLGNIFSISTIYTILIGNFILTTFVIINLYGIKPAISILVPLYSLIITFLTLTLFFVFVWALLKGTNYIYKLTKSKKEKCQKKKIKQKKR